jgi:hypothetical protein
MKQFEDSVTISFCKKDSPITFLKRTKASISQENRTCSRSLPAVGQAFQTNTIKLV